MSNGNKGASPPDVVYAVLWWQVGGYLSSVEFDICMVVTDMFFSKAQIDLCKN